MMPQYDVEVNATAAKLAAQLVKDMGKKVELTVDRTNICRNCLTCGHFTEASEQCKLFSARPPAKIIAYGCEKFAPNADYIPF